MWSGSTFKMICHKCDVMWAGKEDEDAEPCWICGKKGEQYQHTPWRRSP
jgi:rubrerythrin